jgi:hypothetical protein
MKIKKKKNISPASAKLWSDMEVKSLSPKNIGVKNGLASIGVTLTPEMCIDMAASLLVLAKTRNAIGDIQFTATQKNGKCRISFIRSKPVVVVARRKKSNGN